MKNKLTLLRKRSGRRESRDDELSAFKARQQQQILEIAKVSVNPVSISSSLH